MDSITLQDPMQPASTSGPRFRPYASPNHQVTKGRYITSNDPRGYIPVYEYPLNGQWIMMDIDDGYVLWTGIWKALGNSKADIVKMIDSQPDLAPLIRRVRGGYLKIQGTWMPYEVALRLSRRVAWPIRDDLIPLFGPTFPSTCLSPDQPGFGQIVASGNGRRRIRRNNNNLSSTAGTSLESQANWTVVTPLSDGNPIPALRRDTYPPATATAGPSSRYPSDPYLQMHARGSIPPLTHSQYASAPVPSAPPTSRDRGLKARYSPYPGHSDKPQPRKTSSSSLRVPDPHPGPRPPSASSQARDMDVENIVLPPIRPPSRLRTSSQTTYALPPISALEDLRGMHSHDSAAVLRRLQSDDDFVSGSERLTEEQQWTRRRSLSVPPYRIPSQDNSMSMARGPPTSRSIQDPSEYVLGGESPHRTYNSRRQPSEPIQDGNNSTGDTSPMSPSTPVSSAKGGAYPELVPLAVLKDKSRMVSAASYAFPRAAPSFSWGSERGGGQTYEGVYRTHDARVSVSACRNSCGDDSEDEESVHSRRPW